jgi:hypothetical protein
MFPSDISVRVDEVSKRLERRSGELGRFISIVGRTVIEALEAALDSSMSMLSRNRDVLIGLSSGLIAGLGALSIWVVGHALDFDLLRWMSIGDMVAQGASASVLPFVALVAVVVVWGLVRWSIRRILNPATGYPSSASLAAVTRVVARDGVHLAGVALLVAVPTLTAVVSSCSRANAISDSDSEVVVVMSPGVTLFAASGVVGQTADYFFLYGLRPCRRNEGSDMDCTRVSSPGSDQYVAVVRRAAVACLVNSAGRDDLGAMAVACPTDADPAAPPVAVPSAQINLFPFVHTSPEMTGGSEVLVLPIFPDPVKSCAEHSIASGLGSNRIKLVEEIGSALRGCSGNGARPVRIDVRGFASETPFMCPGLTVEQRDRLNLRVAEVRRHDVLSALGFRTADGMWTDPKGELLLTYPRKDRWGGNPDAMSQRQYTTGGSGTRDTDRFARQVEIVLDDMGECRRRTS